MYKERANLHEQIAESQKILREKFKKFKKGVYDIEDDVTKTLKPIIQPLNKLVENSSEKKEKMGIIRHSTPDLEDYSNMHTSGEDSDDDVISEDENINQRNRTFDVEDNHQSPNNFQIDDGSNILDVNNPEITNDLTNDNNPVEYNIELKTDKLVSRYMNMVRRRDGRVDQVLGVRKLSKGFKLGDSSFTYNNQIYKIRGSEYKITPGLTELIFNKNPNDYLITDEDKNNYRNIIKNTNAHMKRYKSNSELRKNLSDKYKKYLSETGFKRKQGKGFKIARKNDITEYVYWDDPNELVNRLKLLDAERAAGNNNHDNEIQNILEELYERGYIT